MYGLDLHCSMILEEYQEKLPVFERMKSIVYDLITEMLANNGILVTAIESRIKTEKSLAGKLELKGSKYRFLSDITDILGARVITFYSDDVEKIAALIENNLDIDWDNSVDKRKLLQLDTFGYMSLHYVCKIPEKVYFDPEFPELNEYRFEIQLRSALQHVWANMNHDTGYKSGVEIPREYLRSMSRLAGILELADAECSRIRRELTDYRRQVESLVANGDFDKVNLNGDTFNSYLELKPFDNLLNRIAALNQAEISESSPKPYLPVLLSLKVNTLGDLERLIHNNSEDAYELARRQIGNTDIDIISSTVAIQDLCIVVLLKSGAGVAGLEFLFDQLGGSHESNHSRAVRLFELSQSLSFMNKKTSNK